MFSFFQKFDFIYSRAFRIYLVSLAGLVLLALIIIIVVITSGNKPPPAPVDIPEPKSLILSDFLLPEDYFDLSGLKPIPSRDRKTRWTQEEISRFWIDPRIMGISSLEAENDEKVREFFSDIP